MKRTMRNLLIVMLSAVMLCMTALPVFADVIPPQQVKYTPSVVTKINTATRKVNVYGYKGTTLHVVANKAELAKAKYKKEGFQTVTIKPQKAGTKIGFYLVSSYGTKGKTVSVTVKAVANEKKTSSLKKPKVSGKITNCSTSIRVNAQKNTTLVIKNDQEKVLLQKKWTKTGYQNVKIKIPTNSKYLYLYVTAKGKRSAFITCPVTDKIAPAAPKITREDAYGAEIVVKGEIGSYVYLNGGNGWTRVGAITSKNGLRVIAAAYVEPGRKSYQIRLKDAAGNKSKVAKVQYSGGVINVH